MISELVNEKILISEAENEIQKMVQGQVYNSNIIKEAYQYSETLRDALRDVPTHWINREAKQ